MTEQQIHPELKKRGVEIIQAGPQCFYWQRKMSNGNGTTSSSYKSSWDEVHRHALSYFNISVSYTYDFGPLTDAFNSALKPKTHIVVTYSMPIERGSGLLPLGATIEKIEYR